MRTEDQGMCRRVRLTVRLGSDSGKPQYGKSSGCTPTWSGCESSTKRTASMSSWPKSKALQMRCIPSITRPSRERITGNWKSQSCMRRMLDDIPAGQLGRPFVGPSTAHRFLELTPMERADAANLSPVRSDGRRPRHVARLARRGSGTACALRSLWATPSVGGNRHAALTRAEDQGASG